MRLEVRYALIVILILCMCEISRVGLATCIAMRAKSKQFIFVCRRVLYIPSPHLQSNVDSNCGRDTICTVRPGNDQRVI